MPADDMLVLPLSSSHLIDGIVDDLDGMELVEGDVGMGQALGDPLMNAGPMSMQTSATTSGSPPCAVRSSANAATVAAFLALGREDDTGAINVDEERDVVVAASGGGLVDRHSRDSREIGARSGAFDVMVNDAP